MIIDVLVCKPDGTQVFEKQEVPDNYFTSPTPAEQREEAYNTEAIIPWDGQYITVTAAAQLWQYYSAEGNAKAEELQTLIAQAKATIREKYPDL